MENSNWITSGWKNGREGESGFEGIVSLSENGFVVGDSFDNIDLSQLNPLPGNDPSFAGSNFGWKPTPAHPEMGMDLALVLIPIQELKPLLLYQFLPQSGY